MKRTRKAEVPVDSTVDTQLYTLEDVRANRDLYEELGRLNLGAFGMMKFLLINKNVKGYALVLTNSRGQILGWSSIERKIWGRAAHDYEASAKRLNDFPEDTEFAIIGVYVDPIRRKSGYGSLLLKEAMHFCRKNGWKTMAAPEEPNAIKMFQKLNVDVMAKVSLKRRVTQLYQQIREG